MTSNAEKEVENQIDQLQEQKDLYAIHTSHRAFRFILIFAAAAFCIFFLKFGVYSLAVHKEILASQGPIPWIFESLPDAARWGQLGDFMGGLFNPVIGLLTIYLLLANARMQKRELQNSLREMKTSNSALASQANLMEFQSVQNAFFNWIGHYREQLKYSSFVNPNTQQEYNGVEALRARYDYYFSEGLLKKALKDKVEVGDTFLKELRRDGQVDDEAAAELIEQILLKQWRLMYGEQQGASHSALKAIVALLRWIDKQPSSIMSSSRKAEYFSIVESHLSTTELLYLYFSGWTIMGADNVELLKRYKFFKSLVGKSRTYANFLAKRPNCPYRISSENVLYDSGVEKRIETSST